LKNPNWRTREMEKKEKVNFDWNNNAFYFLIYLDDEFEEDSKENMSCLDGENFKSWPAGDKDEASVYSY